jgi:hypothetical protein
MSSGVDSGGSVVAPCGRNRRKGDDDDDTDAFAALQHSLEQPPQQIALTKAAMAVLRKGRVVGHRAIESQTAEMQTAEME